MDPTHIRTFDVARILHDQTELARNWIMLREGLHINEGRWAQVIQISRTQSLYHSFLFILDTWSRQLGWQNSTVGVVFDSLHSLGYTTAASKKKKRT
jgi:hypothetical protein